MFCGKCGAQLNEGQNFCSKCGAPARAGSQTRDLGDRFRDEVDRTERSMGREFDSARRDLTGSGPYYRTPLKTDRTIAVYILLSIITCGFYSYYFVYNMAKDINIACDGDGETTGGLAMFILLSALTCGVYSYYWQYKLGNRLCANASRYHLSFQENGTSVLMWDLIGILLCGIGPYVAMNILMKNTNAICAAYNRMHGLSA